MSVRREVLDGRVWQIMPAPDQLKIDRVQSLTNGYLNRVMVALLLLRGFDTLSSVRAFLFPREGQVHDPFRMRGMDRLIHQLLDISRRNESIVVYGDYDADGQTATSFMIRAFRSFGIDAHPVVPIRSKHGYGLNLELIQEIADRGFRHVITVDAGVTGGKVVEQASRMGVQVMVTDHHLPDADLPFPSDGILVNPHQDGCLYPNKMLCGVGVAYKVMLGLALRMKVDPLEHVHPYLDLVAMGTIADVVSLRDPENRWIVKNGMKVLRESRSEGIKALAALTNVPLEKFTEHDLSWKVIPKANSVGRLASASMMVDLLLSDDASEVAQIIPEVVRLNNRRKELSDESTSEVRGLCENDQDLAAFVYGRDYWHPGVVGISAGHVAEDMGRPVMLMGKDLRTGNWSGSGRAGNPNVHLRDMLMECRPRLLRFGGHKGAAGFTLKGGDETILREFSDEFNSIVERNLSLDQRVPTVSVDLEVNLDELSEHIYNSFQELRPFGEGNPPPVFLVRRCKVLEAAGVGNGGRTLRMRVEQSGRSIGCIGFGKAEQHPGISAGDFVDLVFSYERNDFNGRTSMQLNIKDLRRVPG